VEEANKKFKKYYDIMDSSDIFYLSATLDPRLKAVWLKDHLEAKHSIIVNQIMEKIKSQYHVEIDINITAFLQSRLASNLLS